MPQKLDITTKCSIIRKEQLVKEATMGTVLNWLGGLVVMVLWTTVMGFLSYGIIDSAGVESIKTVQVTVEGKQIVPPQNTFTLGRIMIPGYTPKTHRLSFMIDDDPVHLDVDEEVYNDIKNGDKVSVAYGLGRVSNAPYPTKVTLVEQQ